ncbi:MAG: endonuclease domain-containing protein [Butyricicoccus sp.]|nr:endonuclease domain-containing protein [Butyricicoccus sp.]
MDHPRNEVLTEKARKLRKNMTKEEKHLWYDFLRKYPVRFRRQEIIGNYIVDFCCFRTKLIVELDGSQHYEEAGFSYDSERTAYLESLGFHVLRFSNPDVLKSFDAVCRSIDLDVCKHLNCEPFVF